MTMSVFMHGWAALVGSLAMISLILTALGIMIGIVKPADRLKHIEAILSSVIVLMFAPGVLVSAWSGMSLWQKMTLVSIGVGVWQWLRPQRRTQSRRKE